MDQEIRTADVTEEVDVEPKPSWWRRTLSGRKVPEDQEPSPSSVGMLVALQGRQLYAGTVSPQVKTRRRAASKVARRSRRANRGQR